MSIKSFFFLLFSFSIIYVSGQTGKKGSCSKNSNTGVSDSLKLMEILKISKRIDSLISSNYSNKPTKLDSSKIDSLINEINNKSSLIKQLSIDAETNKQKIVSIEKKIELITTNQEYLITELKKSPKIDNKTFLELYFKSLNSQSAPSNLADLKEFQSLSNLVDICEEYQINGFTKFSDVRQKLDELKSKEQIIKSYPGLASKSQRILQTLNDYEKKVNELNEHLERYYVTYKNANAKEEDRILYLKDIAINFKDYPYLLKLIFEAMEKPNGTNLLKSKLK
jgi:hypothetical protein